jgi:hypothetical protein
MDMSREDRLGRLEAAFAEVPVTPAGSLEELSRAERARAARHFGFAQPQEPAMPEPIGYVTVLGFRDGTYDADSAGMRATAELAAAEAADPELTRRLNEGERLVVCSVTRVEEL